MMRGIEWLQEAYKRWSEEADADEALPSHSVAGPQPPDGDDQADVATSLAAIARTLQQDAERRRLAEAAKTLHARAVARALLVIGLTLFAVLAALVPHPDLLGTFLRSVSQAAAINGLALAALTTIVAGGYQAFRYGLLTVGHVYAAGWLVTVGATIASVQDPIGNPWWIGIQLVIVIYLSLWLGRRIKSYWRWVLLVLLGVYLFLTYVVVTYPSLFHFDSQPRRVTATSWGRFEVGLYATAYYGFGVLLVWGYARLTRLPPARLGGLVQRFVYSPVTALSLVRTKLQGKRRLKERAGPGSGDGKQD